MAAVTPRLLFVAFAAVFTMSLVPVLVKLTEANPETIGLVRIVVVLSLLTPLLLLRRQLRGGSRRDWQGLAVLGLVFGLHWWCYFTSIKLAGAAVASIAVSTFGIHLLVLNAWRQRQPLRASDLLAVSLCLFGCYLVAPVKNVAGSLLVGFWVGVLSGFLYALLPLLHQRISHLGTLARTWGQFAFAGLFFLLLSGAADFHLQPRDWWLLLTLGVVCTAVAHSLWVKATTELPAGLVSAIYYLYVPNAMVLSALFVGERITAGMGAGAALIVGANMWQLRLSWRRRT